MRHSWPQKNLREVEIVVDGDVESVEVEGRVAMFRFGMMQEGEDGSWNKNEGEATYPSV